MVGYKNPPIEHQFKSGWEGGPGRPKGSKNFSTILEEFLGEATEVEKDGRKLIAKELFCWNLLTQAMTAVEPKDRLAASKEIMDRMEGKPSQTNINQYQDAEGNSVNVNVTIGGKNE